jgi:acetyl-CoA hydrolase
MHWSEAFRRKVTTADEAVKVIESGSHVWVHAGCNNPEELIRAMTRRSHELEGVEVAHLLTFGAADYADPKYAGSFRHRALFTGSNVRQAVNEGRADWVPIYLHMVPRLITEGLLPVDVALIHISVPDEHGFCSFGVGVECTKAAAERARTVIALSTGRCRAGWATRSSTSRSSRTSSRSTARCSSCRRCRRSARSHARSARTLPS